MIERIKGKRYKNIRTWQNADHTKTPPWMTKALSPRNKTELPSLQNPVRFPNLYSKAIDESARLPLDTLGSVMSSVNSLSR